MSTTPAKGITGARKEQQLNKIVNNSSLINEQQHSQKEGKQILTKTRYCG